MKRIVHSFVSLALAFSTVGRAETPKGFEDPVLLDKVMDGEIVITSLVDNKNEMRSIVRSFFKKVSPEAYQQLAVNHAKYPDMFKPEVLSASTKKVNDAKTEYEYEMQVLVKMGPLESEVTPLLKQTLTIAPDAVSEGKVEQTILNYPDKVMYSRQTTRLIPYKEGILVEDDIHFILTKEGAAGGLVKKYLKNLFSRYSQTFRTALGG